MRKIAFIVLLIASAIGAHAQTHACSFKENIRTLRVERMALVLDKGVVDGSDPENTLHISFDEMSHDVHFYTYTVEMLRKDHNARFHNQGVGYHYYIERDGQLYPTRREDEVGIHARLSHLAN